MRFLFIEHIENAVQSLKSTRMRTLLTTLGVAIGVSSIVTILSLSSGISHIIDRQVDALGGNIAVLRPGADSKSLGSFVNPVSQQNFSTSTITEEDLTDIQEIPGILAAAPIMKINGSISSSSNTVPSGSIVATTPEFADIDALPIRDGQFIDSVTNRDTAVIGAQLSVNLFGTDQSIGQQFSIRGQNFTIIGVLKPLNNPVNYNNIDLDQTAFISMESGKSFHQGVSQIQQINIRAKDASQLPRILQLVKQKVVKNHLGEQDFTLISGDEISKPTSKLFSALTGVMTAIAAISLVVGGVGIMNIMLVGVAERTREIGLRKSVGASNGNIIAQFLTESLILSLIGGGIGYIAGYIIAFAISTFLTFDPAFTWAIALSAIGTSMVVGVIFGLYPAIRAARKDPIESLRQYH